MLKFIRKYQLFILVIGGSLLMVVFLLEPVLTRLAPSPMKAKVATLEDGSKFTRADIQRANTAISLLKRVNPRALGTREVGGLGLDTSSESSTALHWLLLVKQAEAAGLVGEAGDGANWIAEIATTEAFLQVRAEVMQGMTSSTDAETRLQELTQQITTSLNRNATLSAANAGGRIEDVHKILAQARGITRLYSAVDTLPAFSDVNATLAAHDQFDSVAVNAAVLDAGLLASTIADPTDEQIQSFFDIYKAQAPSDNEFNIGYTQPTRIQVGWLTLDTEVFRQAVVIDRIELNKLWRQNRDIYPDDFAVERINLERQLRDDESVKMMAKADQIIRAQLVTETKNLPSNDGILELPEDWESRRPRLEDMADLIVERINDQFGVSLPRPAITMIGDRWLTANDLFALPGFGQSSYRVGSRELPAYSLTQFFELTESNTTGLDVQVGLPLVNPAAQDRNGNRYYAVVLGVRDAGPADTIEDVTRDRVIADYKAIEGFKTLQASVETLRSSIASSNDLAPAISMITSMASDPTTVIRPPVLKHILVRRDTIEQGSRAARVDPRMNDEDFRSSVLAAAEDINPLIDPNTPREAGLPVVTVIPGSKALLIANVVAPRPVTDERFKTISRQVIMTAAREELNKAREERESPFSFAALSERYGLVQLDEENAMDPNADS